MAASDGVKEFGQTHGFTSGLILLIVGGIGAYGALSGNLAAMLAALFQPTDLYTVVNINPTSGGPPAIPGPGSPPTGATPGSPELPGAPALPAPSTPLLPEIPALPVSLV